ncbi:MAG: class I tRNA ligase family protein [Candidatus Ranarchaeia archaeon]
MSFEFLSDVRYYNQFSSKLPKIERASVLHYILNRWLRLLTPVIPHFAEELWERNGNSDFISIASWPAADEALIDPISETSMIVVQNTLEDLRGVLNLIKGKKPNHAIIYTAPEWMYSTLNLIKTKKIPLTIKDIMLEVMKNPELKKRGKQVTELVKRITKLGKIPQFSTSNSETSALKESLDDLEEITHLEIQITPAEGAKMDPMNKAKFALPGKPAFFLDSK